MAEKTDKKKKKEPNVSPTTKYKNWYKEGRDAASDWKKESRTAAGFYHGGKHQWAQKDRDALTQEGRPVLSINRIKPTIDLQKGIEIRSRTDIDAKPRKEDFAKTADAITAGFKYVQDQNNADHIISDVFFDGLKAGIGWLEVCENDDPREEEIQIKYADWRRVGFDPYARHILLDDARYIYLDNWVDLEVAQMMWPNKKEELLQAVRHQEATERKHGDQYSIKSGGYDNAEKIGWIDTARKRVLLVQMYFKKTELAIFLKMKDGEAVEVTAEELEKNPLMVANPNVLKVKKVPVDKMYYVIFSGDALLEEEKPSPYKHNHYPLIPFICYMDEDGAPYGMIANMMDPQREINKNRSQYSHILNTYRVFFETGSVKNLNDAKKQISRPDAWIELIQGALTQKKFQFSQDIARAREHFEIMKEAKRELQEVSGAVEEQMGQPTNARSGIAIEARSRQGATVNTEPFDNMRLTKRRLGEILLSMMKQHWQYEKVIRITDDKDGSDKFITFNKDGNNISQGRYDIVVSDHPETETTRNWMSRTLMDFASRMPPDIALPVMQTAFEMSDVPNKEKVLEGIQKAAKKQDELTQQRAIIDTMGKDKPPPAGGETPAAPSPA